MNGFLLISALVGTTLLLVHGTIFVGLRRIWPALFACAQCTGTWVGAGAGASGLVSTGHGRVLGAVIVGTATSFLSLLAYAVLVRLLGDPND
jgi:hypothetical protein